jgi:hypothetical protein
MSIEGLIQQLTFSNNSLNVILTWGIAMLGLSLSLLTLSVAFVVSGKISKDDFIEQIKSKGISISSGSKYKKSSNATMLMQLIAKYSLHWFYVNLFFCIVLIAQVLCEINYFKIWVSLLSDAYMLVSLIYIFIISCHLIKWYKRNIT